MKSTRTESFVHVDVFAWYRIVFICHSDCNLTFRVSCRTRSRWGVFTEEHGEELEECGQRLLYEKSALRYNGRCKNGNLFSIIILNPLSRLRWLTLQRKYYWFYTFSRSISELISLISENITEIQSGQLYVFQMEQVNFRKGYLLFRLVSCISERFCISEKWLKLIDWTNSPSVKIDLNYMAASSE